MERMVSMQDGLAKPAFMVDKFMLSIGLLTLAAIIGVIFFLSKPPATVSPVVDRSKAQELLAVKSSDWVQGPENAPITIVEYLDFECEACRVYHSIVKQLKADYKDDLRLVIRYYPLPGHMNAMTSAQAAEAAGKQGKFWEMYDVLYENMPEWGGKQTADPKLFEKYASQIGLNMEQYQQDVVSSAVRDRINQDKSSGNALAINGTPTFFINGEKIPNPRGYEDFKSLIEGLRPAK